MNRFALLIEASDVSCEQELPGARNDVIALRNYLMSSIGGAWLEKEIRILNKPLIKEVSEILELHKDDYCFVYFSGHGSEHKQGKPTVCLNDVNRECPVRNLYPHGLYGVVIADCCRGKGEEEQATENMKTASFSITESCDEADNGRRTWESALRQCLNSNPCHGIVEMLACQYNEDANETDPPDAYGEYTHALLSEAKQWFSTANHNCFLSTKKMHNRIYNYMVSKGQHPCYAPSNLEYPFAVKR